MIIIQQGPPDPANDPHREWLKLEHGRIVALDWDTAEAVRDANIAGIRPDQVGWLGMLVVAVREHVLASIDGAPRIGAKTEPGSSEA